MDRWLRNLRTGPARLDEQAAERLLTGTLDPDDAPPNCRGVAVLLRAANAPPAPDELRGEPAAMAAFTAARRGPAHTRTLSFPKKPSMVSRLLTAKVAIATLVAVVAVGGAATATTIARTSSENARTKVVRDVGKADNGPDANAPDKGALCRAWAAGNGADNGAKADSTAFRALVKAAGGEDKVAAFCAASGVSPSTRGKGGTDKGQGLDPDGATNKQGLCKAWAAGNVAESSKAKRGRMGSAAFDSLANAAGGVENIPAYCATSTTGQTSAGRSEEHGAPPAEAGQGSEQDRQGGSG